MNMMKLNRLMKITKTESYVQIDIMGWKVYLTKVALRKRTKKKNTTRLNALKARLAMAGNRCEICGRPIDIRCSLHHRLPVGAEGRNSVENVMVLCSACHHKLEAEPHVMGLQHLEDTTRYCCDAE